MRCGDEVFRAEQHVFLGRLDREHIKRRAGEVAALEEITHRSFIDEAAAGAVDEDKALFGFSERFARQDVLGLLRQRNMQRDHIGASEQRIEINFLDAEFHSALFRQERVIGHDFHLEADGALGNAAADIAATDEAERLVGDFEAHIARLRPLAGLRVVIGRRDLAGGGEHHRDGMLGGRDGVAERRVHDDDALGGGGLDVDIVDADTGPADDLEVGGRRDHVSVRLAGRTHGEAVILRDDLDQIFLGQTNLDVGFDAARLEDFDGGGGERVSDEDFRHVVSFSGKNFTPVFPRQAVDKADIVIFTQFPNAFRPETETLVESVGPRIRHERVDNDCLHIRIPEAGFDGETHGLPAEPLPAIGRAADPDIDGAQMGLNFAPVVRRFRIRIDNLKACDGPPVQLGDEVLVIVPHEGQLVRPVRVTERLGGVGIIGCR